MHFLVIDTSSFILVFQHIKAKFASKSTNRYDGVRNKLVPIGAKRLGMGYCPSFNQN
jgi:hypothetical protein